MSRGVALVTGATGAVGPVVVRRLQQAGYHVRTLSRRRPTEPVRDAGIDIRVGDICRREDVRDAVSGTAVVIHLAALLHQFGPGSAALEAEYAAVNVQGTGNVVGEALAAGVARIVYLSTIAVYGPTGGAIASERTPPRPETIYARTKLAGEEIVRGATRDGTPSGVVLRAAAVYGPRVKGNYRRLAEATARGRYVAIGPGRNRRTIVHEQDLAEAIVLAADHPGAPGLVLNVSDGSVHELADIVAAICHAAGRRAPRLHVPVGLARLMVRVGDAASSVSGIRLPLSRHTLEKYLEDVAVDATLIQRVLGFVPAMSLEAGWRDTMKALMRDEPA